MGRGPAVHAARAGHDARSPAPGARRELAAARGVGGHSPRCRRARAQAVRACGVPPTRGPDPAPGVRSCSPGWRGGPLRALQLAGEWRLLLDVVDWLEDHPRPGVYLRQMDVPGVHSKFVEAHRGVLGELFDLSLSPESIDAGAPSGVAGFARRYGFREKPERIRFRVLDPRPCPRSRPARKTPAARTSPSTRRASRRCVPACPACSSPRTRSTSSPSRA